VVEIGESWQDHRIFLGLGKRMGQQWWDTVEDPLDWLMEPTSVTWEQFKEKGLANLGHAYLRARDGPHEKQIETNRRSQATHLRIHT